MNDTPLTIDTLGDLDDGTVRHVVNTTLQEVLADCDNRAMLDKSRKVTITVEMRPRIDNNGAMIGVATDVSVKGSVPPRAGNTSILRTAIRGDDVEAYMPDSYARSLFAREGN